MKIKALSAAGLAVCFALAVAGCTSENTGGKEGALSAADNLNPTGLPIVKEPITVTVLFPRDPTHGDFEKMWYIDELARKTNIRLKIIPVESAGWEEKKSLAFATGDLPDLFLSGLTDKDENVYGPQQLLIPLTGLIDRYAPLTKQLLGQYPEVKKTFTFEDGSIYALPVFNSFKRDLVGVGSNSFINRQWLSNLGLAMPRTLDELYAVLKAFKEKDPNGNGKADEIPMSGLNKGVIKLYILSAVGFVDPRHDVINGKYVYVPMQPAYKEYLTFMNRLYAEGLLDRDYFSQTREQLYAKEAEMRLGLYADGGGTGNIKGDDYKQLVIPPPLTSAVNAQKVWRSNPPYSRYGSFAITNKAKHPEALVRLLDFMYSEEGSIMGRTGPEYGKWSGSGGYELVDFKGVKAFKPHYDGFNSYYNFRAQHTLMNVPLHMSEQYGTYLTYGDEKNAWLTDVINASGRLDSLRVPYPEVKFKKEEQEKIASYVDLDTYAEQMEAKFIMGETPLTAWDSYLATLKKLGAEDMSAIRQQAYDRWNKAGK